MNVLTEQYAILIFSPPRFEHSKAFLEIAESLNQSLLDLGLISSITTRIISGRRHIILGAFLVALYPEYLNEFPSNSIIYNFEQSIVFQKSDFADAIKLYQKHYLFDYNLQNCHELAFLGCSHATYLPVGYSPVLTRINNLPEEKKNIDVLFYGALNERRKVILQCLEDRGLIVKQLYGVYGKERDSFIARSKIILNLHQYNEGDPFEVLRIIYLLANQAFVLSEESLNDVTFDELKSGFTWTNYSQIVDSCCYYLDHPTERKKISEAGFELIKQRSQTEYLKQSLESLSPPNQNAILVDLGCGTRKFPGFTGVDIYPAPGVDIVADLTSRFPFDDNTVDCIRAYDLIECIPDRINTMNEIWRVCKEGALVNLLVPSSDGRGAFQDPTHVSFWNLNSFRYFTQESPWFLKLCQQYGFKGCFSLVSLRQYEGPDHVIHVHALLKAIKFPAVDLPEKPVFVALIPDWRLTTDTLVQEMATVLSALVRHPDSQSICLVVDIGNALDNPEVSPEEILVDAAMTVMFEQNIDIETQGLALAFADFQDPQQWRLLEPKLGYCLTLADQGAPVSRLQSLPTLECWAPSAFSECPLSLRFGHLTTQIKWLNTQISDPRIKIDDFTHAKGPVNWQIESHQAQIIIGKFCMIEANVTICAGQSQSPTASSTNYPFDTVFRLKGPSTPVPTRIGHDVQIGFGSYIAAGITIGHGAVIKPGTWVFQSVEPYTIVAGNPAIKISDRFSQDQIQYLLQLGWWDWPLSRILANLDQLQA